MDMASACHPSRPQSPLCRGGGLRTCQHRRRRSLHRCGLSRELATDQSIERNILLGSFDGELAMLLGRNTHRDVSLVPARGDRLWDWLLALGHVLEDVSDELGDAVQCVSLRRRKPAQGRELRAQTNVLM